MLLHARLDKSSSLCDFFEPVEPLRRAAARQVKIELVAGPSADGPCHQNTDGIETTKIDHHDRPGVHNIAFDYRRNEDAEISQQMHEVFDSALNVVAG